MLRSEPGQIWLYLDIYNGGLCRYDGKKITVFNKRSGFSDEACYTLAPDTTGNLFVTTSKNRLYKFRVDSFHEQEIHPDLKNLTGEFQYVYAINLAGKAIYASTQYATFLIDIPARRIKRQVLKDTFQTYYLMKTKAGLQPINQTHGRNNYTEVSIVIGDSIQNTLKRIRLPHLGSQSPSFRVLTAKTGVSQNLIAIGNMVVILNSDYSYRLTEMKHPVISLYSDKEGNFWVGTFKGGVYYFTSEFSTPIRELEELSVSSVVEDSEGGIWCTTLEDGVFYTSSKHLLNYAEIPGLNKRQSVLKRVGNKILASSNSTICGLENKQVTLFNTGLESEYQVLDVAQDREGFYLLGTNFICKADKRLKFSNFIYLRKDKLLQGGRQFATATGGKIYYIHYSSLGSIFEDGLEETLRLSAPGKCLLTLNDTMVLLGCKDGLYEANLHDFNVSKISGISGNVSSLFRDSQGQIWISTENSGLYLMNSDSVTDLTKLLNLPIDRFQDICQDISGKIWRASNAGLFRIHFLNHKFTVDHFNEEDGMPNSELNKIACDSFRIYFSTSSGLQSLPLNIEDKPSRPKILLSNLMSEGHLIDLSQSKISLPYERNNLQFSFDVVNYKVQNFPLVWKLSGFDERYRTFDNLQISLTNLAAGDYTLVISSEAQPQKLLFSFRFVILRPFWQTWWFLTLMSLFTIGVLYFAVRTIVRNVKRKANEKTELNRLMAEYQLTALQA